MASVLKDEAVVAHVEKQVAKAVAANTKALAGKLKAAHASHAEGLGEDKAAKKAVAAFHKTAQDAIKG